MNLTGIDCLTDPSPEPEPDPNPNPNLIRIDYLRELLDTKKAEREANIEYGGGGESEIIDEEEYAYIQVRLIRARARARARAPTPTPTPTRARTRTPTLTRDRGVVLAGARPQAIRRPGKPVASPDAYSTVAGAVLRGGRVHAWRSDLPTSPHDIVSSVLESFEGS